MRCSSWSSQYTALEIELHEASADDRIVVIRRDLAEAERLAEREGLLHRRQGVQAHPRVADRARLADHGLGQAASQACAAGRRADVEALHLAEAAGEWPQRHAAARFDAVDRQEEAAGRRRVGPGQRGDLLREALERELDAQRGLVLLEEPSRRGDLVRRRRGDDVEAHVRTLASPHVRKLTSDKTAAPQRLDTDSA